MLISLLRLCNVDRLMRMHKAASLPRSSRTACEETLGSGYHSGISIDKNLPEVVQKEPTHYFYRHKFFRLLFVFRALIVSFRLKTNKLPENVC